MLEASAAAARSRLELPAFAFRTAPHAAEDVQEVYLSL